MKQIIAPSAKMLVVVAALAVIGQACTDSNAKNNSIPKNTEPVPVRLAFPSRSDRASVITISGQLTTDDETLLSFKLPGVVGAVLVKEGDHVSKGQLLARLELTEVNAQVAQSRLAFEKAQRDFQRVTHLYRDSVATLEQMQNAQTALSVAKEQMDAAVFNRSFAEIHAPTSGTVLRKFVNTGQVVSVGSPVLQTNGAGQNAWILKAGVSDKQWAAVRIGDRATIRVDAFAGKTFDASVIRKSGTSDPVTGAFAIELQLKNLPEKLAAGMFASAELQTQADSNGWSVPYEAVLDANGNEAFVFVTADFETVHKIPVTVESFNAKSIRISAGLEGKEALVVSGSAYLSEGSPITVIK